MPTAGPATAATIGFLAAWIVLRKRTVGLESSVGGAFMKSCRSFPAVKHSFVP